MIVATIWHYNLSLFNDNVFQLYHLQSTKGDEVAQRSPIQRGLAVVGSDPVPGTLLSLCMYLFTGLTVWL